MHEITIQEQKIIDDILFHLDGWTTNDHPRETRRVDAFLDTHEPKSTNNVRKEVSSREVLTAYEKAKIHALNYTRRKEFPDNPAVYQAICYWAAGLLSEKAHFKEEKIQESTLLIEEARRLLSPYVKRGEDFFTVSGDDFFLEEYLRSERIPHPRRDRIPPPPPPKKDDPWGGEPKERLTHGHFHRRIPHKPPYKPCPPPPRHDRDLSWLIDRKHGKKKYKIEVDPINVEEGDTCHIRAKVTRNGRPCNGKIIFYVYD